jgi:hypothetical protein
VSNQDEVLAAGVRPASPLDWYTMWIAFIILSLAVAQEVPPGFKHLKTSGDCAYFFQEGPDDGVPAMRAECSWPEVDPQVLRRLLGLFDQYDDYIFPIVASEIREVTKDKTLVFQRHDVFWFAPREALIWMALRDEEQGFRVRWSVADDRSFAAAKGSIKTKVNKGFWLVLPREEGGVRVSHEVHVDAGGGLPEWLVGFFRTRGFIRIMNAIRARASDPSNATP